MQNFHFIYYRGTFISTGLVRIQHQKILGAGSSVIAPSHNCQPLKSSDGAGGALLGDFEICEKRGKREEREEKKERRKEGKEKRER